MTLTKADIIERIHLENNYSKRRSSEVMKTLLQMVKRTLATGEDVTISGFGKFSVVKKQARLGRNPASAKAMMLRSRKVLKFKCSGKLRHTLNVTDRSAGCAWARTQHC